MKVLYACSFDLSKYSGKDRATRQKLNALAYLVDRLDIISAGKYKPIDFFLLEVKCIYYLIKRKPDVFVSRGWVGFLSVIFCKFIGCKTFREVHADQLGEIKYLDKGVVAKAVLKLIGIYSVLIDRMADVRIFNHPSLMDWYRGNYSSSRFDFYCYNGFEPINERFVNREYVLSKYGLNRDFKYLVFTGSASKWHGVDYLVELQKELNDMGGGIKIICAGGKVSDDIDPDGLLINISPLGDEGCDEIISIAMACLLPVRNNRVSPGSPLKLYDYIKHEKIVVVQNDMLGYSDEVLKYGKGVFVNFENAKEVAFFVSELKNDIQVLTDPSEFNWCSRMKVWVGVFDEVLSAKSK